MRRFTQRAHCKILTYLIVSLLVSRLLSPIPQGDVPVVQAQQPDPVLQLLQSMTVEEKVGQLVLVPFVGTGSGPNDDITILITQYKVGGVILQASNSNFRNTPSTPQEIAALTNALQAHTLANKNIPLFIAIDQEGDGWPYTRITGGVTPIPSAMSIGATWKPENAYNIGHIVGRELSAMGINLLLGPVLDVLNNPRPSGKGDMGIRTFGGDPFWVGLMGKAYIQGIHAGSNNTIAAVAKHFPGHGGSDRLPDNEVATVDKSLQELKRIELAPFFTVTNPESTNSDDLSGPGTGSGLTDAMMSSHIRYRGLQGDIRQFTAPISFDAQGMQTLLQLPEFVAWRSQGGLIISDALGVPAVRKHYDPTLQTFPHRRVAREAFLAGNDILSLGQFDLRSIWSVQFENIKDTLEFFQSEYRTDPEFAARVDESVARILRLKLKLFPNPSPNALFVDGEVALAVSGQGQEAVQQIAQESLTLLYPTPDEYKRRLIRPPEPNEKILIVSDVRQVRECYLEECEPFEPLPYQALEKVILERYGPNATHQILPENVASMSFAELKQVLVGSLAQVNQPTETALSQPADFRSPEEVMALIQAADWIIFAMLDLNTSRFATSDALKLFLAQGLNSLDKKLIVFALNSPYSLDTTEVNKLTAYFGLYSKTQPHLEIAIRALFGEIVPTGASPVSVDGLGYDLPRVLSPDPIRAFPLQVKNVEPASQHPPVVVTLQAGPILDYNGHPVPDGTPVEFMAAYGSSQTINLPLAHTLKGQAEATLQLTEPGLVEITARSGDAESQRPQMVNLTSPLASPTHTPTPTTSPTATAEPIPQGDVPVPQGDVPAATPTTTPTATTAATLSQSPTAEPIATPTPLPAAIEPMRPDYTVGGLDFLMALADIFLVSLVGMFLWQKSYHTPSQRVRLILVIFIGGMVGYLVYGLGWLRLDLWLAPEASLTGQRVILAALVLIFGLLGRLVERQIRRFVA